MRNLFAISFIIIPLIMLFGVSTTDSQTNGSIITDEVREIYANVFNHAKFKRIVKRYCKKGKHKFDGIQVAPNFIYVRSRMHTFTMDIDTFDYFYSKSAGNSSTFFGKMIYNELSSLGMDSSNIVVWVSPIYFDSSTNKQYLLIHAYIQYPRISKKVIYKCLRYCQYLSVHVELSYSGEIEEIYGMIVQKE